MSLKKIMGTALGTAALATGLSIAATTPASAGVFSDCADGYACFWQNDGFSGAKWQFSGWNSNWGDFGRSNQDESAKNDGNTSAVVLYDGTGYTGAWFCLAKGYSVDNYYAVSGGIYGDNRTSSNSWYSGAGGYC